MSSIKALQEIARLVELGRFTYVHYRNDEIEEAFEAVKYESFKNKDEKWRRKLPFSFTMNKREKFCYDKEVREREFTYGVY